MAMKKFTCLLLLGSVWSYVAICPLARAEDKESGAKVDVKTDSSKTDTTKADRAKDNGRSQERTPYLGVGLEPLHPAMLRHLPQLLRDGRGIMVAEVTPDSPADKSGIKTHDIIVSYDDQKVYSPQQLAKLIHHDKAGREVKLGVIREGKAEDLQVTLGEHHTRREMRNDHDADHARRMIRGPMADRIRNRLVTNSERLHDWTSFDAMTITRADKDHFNAEIKYRDKDGKVESRHFAGTHDELRKAIEAQKDLPDNEREHLLRALDLPGHGLEIDLPGVKIVPNGETRPSSGI
jgi:hypothetical protein